MSAPLASPRLAVTAAVTVLVALTGLLAVRMTGANQGVANSAPPARLPASAIAPSTVPTAKPIVLDQLAIPCWSCPETAPSPLRFRTDLDLLAPLGTGGGNAAEWYAAFTKPDGARAPDADAIMGRRVDHPVLGKILPPGDPFLVEAEPWLDQATMRFYPGIYSVEGFQTKVPNLTLALTLARSLVARGQGEDQFETAMADFGRVVRLGRLLRQDDAMVINDLVGLATIRMGAEAIYQRARADGRLDLALAAAIIAGEAPPQKLLSGARMTSVEVVPYLRRGVGRTSVMLPDGRFQELRKMALDNPDRRFRVIACASLSLIASFGSGDQREPAIHVLETLTGSTDAVVAINARWHLANPISEKRLDELLAEDD